MKKEIWKVLNCNNNYAVSNLGKIKRIAGFRRLKVPNNGVMKNMKWGIAPVKERIIKHFVDERNRPRVNLQGKKYFISNLVAQHFIEYKISDGYKVVVNHIDNNPNNNCVDNLEWITQKQNIQHSINQGRHSSVIRWLNRSMNL